MDIITDRAYSFSQLGQRDNQEDARFPDTDTAAAGQRYFVVCDGVGGSDKGEDASRLVATTIGRQMQKLDLTQEFTDDRLIDVLDHAFIALDEAADKRHADMGTTLTMVVFHAAGCTMAHIGDSRIYHIRPGEGIVYRSDDHSLVNQMVHSGMLTPDEAVNHPQSNVITRCMEPTRSDQRRSMATVFRTRDIRQGDYVLLCTDGVLHCISDEELVALVEDDRNCQEKVRALADRCKDSTDNNTAWMVRVDQVRLTEAEQSAAQQARTVNNNDTLPTGTGMMSMTEIESVRRGKKSLLARIKNVFN